MGWPALAIGGGLDLLGSFLNASAQDKARAQIARNNAAQTALDAKLFDARTAQSGKSFADQLALEQQSHAEQAAEVKTGTDKALGIDQTGFQAGEDINNAGFTKSQAIDNAGFGTALEANTGALGSETSATEDAIAKQRAINEGVWGTEDAQTAAINAANDKARTDYNTITQGATAAQAGYHAQAGTALDQALASISDPNNRTNDAAQRTGAVTGNISAPTTTMAGPGVSDLLKSEYANQANQGVAKALSQGTEAAKLASYTGALGDQARTLDTLGNQLSSIKGQSDLALQPVNDQLGVPLTQRAGATSVADMIRSNAESLGTNRIADVNAGAQSKIDLANLILNTTLAANNTKTAAAQSNNSNLTNRLATGNTNYTTKSQGINSDLTNALLGASKDFETSATGANSGENAALQNDNINYQNATSGITNATNAGTQPNLMLGNILSGIGGTALSYGAQGKGPTWLSLGDAIHGTNNAYYASLMPKP